MTKKIIFLTLALSIFIMLSINTSADEIQTASDYTTRILSQLGSPIDKIIVPGRPPKNFHAPAINTCQLQIFKMELTF